MNVAMPQTACEPLESFGRLARALERHSEKNYARGKPQLVLAC